MLVHALSMMFEGVLFATGDARMVARLYLVNAAVVTAGFGALRRRGPTLAACWGAFLAYQVLRASEFGLRVLWNQRRSGQQQQEEQQQQQQWEAGVEGSRGGRIRSLVARTKRRLRALREPPHQQPVVWSSSYAARKYSDLSYDI